MGRGDARNRRVQIPEQFLGDQARDLAPQPHRRGFSIDRVEPAGLRDCGENRLKVEGHQRTDIDHRRGNAMLGLKYLGGFQWRAAPSIKRRDGQVGAVAAYRGGTERIDMFTVRHLALGGVSALCSKKRTGFGNRVSRPRAGL